MRKKHLHEALDSYTKNPMKHNEPGDSINEHRAMEMANILIGEKEIDQQNENL